MTTQTKLSPDEAEALWKEARDFRDAHKRRKSKRAIKLALRLIEDGPNTLQSLAMLNCFVADTYSQHLEEHDTAIHYYRAALTHDPGYSLAGCNLGFVLLKYKHDYAAAVAILEQTLHRGVAEVGIRITTEDWLAQARQKLDEGAPPPASASVGQQNLGRADETGPAATQVSGTTTAEGLMSLRARVEELMSLHPRSPTYVDSSGTGRSQQLIPWICQQLEEAASALESGKDYRGDPITEGQVLAGMRKLIEIVREPNLLMTMEMAYPGIAKPLELSMDELDRIIATATAARPAAVGGPSKGVERLMALCGPGSLFWPTGKDLDEVAAVLRNEGEAGSRALAELIRELANCRHPYIIKEALGVATRVPAVPELREAVRAVAGAPELAEEPAQARFTPEIYGEGRVGWTSGTHQALVGAAEEALRSLESASDTANAAEAQPAKPPEAGNAS